MLQLADGYCSEREKEREDMIETGTETEADCPASSFGCSIPSNSSLSTSKVLA